ncbi:MAG: adenylate/guanylate cyclase domain-containing protein [Alphaproteobacteria bacterium]|nr:adenylate/guanylate cyclase domain-containing protein [Alphaproteobacteria bacterium]
MAEEDPIAHWLITGAAAAPDLRTAVQGLVERLEADNTPILRALLSVGMLHPELLAASYSWQRGDKFVKRTSHHHGSLNTDLFRKSPFHALSDGTTMVRRRLTGPDAQFDFNNLEDLRDAGGTDYVAIALPRSDGSFNPGSFSTDQEGGFTDAQIDRICFLRPYLGIMVEVHGRARMTRTLLDLYLGTNAGPRVYGGQIKRGEGSIINSVLFISDLRGFTKLSEQLPLEHITAVLNDYFEAIIGPVQAHGGEVLKMIGDGVLASFPIDNEGEMDDVCERALDAADLAIANMRILNRRRGRENKPPLECGIGLHVGDAIYGNVGAHDRLDFTVIGPAVNLCARLESLAGRLGEPIICSADFAAHSPTTLKSVGKHELKNVDGAVEAFIPGD